MEGKSLINIMNKRGPKWEPCGMPEVTKKLVDMECDTFTA